MSSEDTKQSCNKFSILGESGAVSPVGKKGATKVFKYGRKSRLFFGSSCNEERCVMTQRKAVEQTTLPLGLKASSF